MITFDGPDRLRYHALRGAAQRTEATNLLGLNAVAAHALSSRMYQAAESGDHGGLAEVQTEILQFLNWAVDADNRWLGEALYDVFLDLAAVLGPTNWATCPKCNKPAIYAAPIGRHLHRESSGNEDCWNLPVSSGVTR